VERHSFADGKKAMVTARLRRSNIILSNPQSAIILVDPVDVAFGILPTLTIGTQIVAVPNAKACMIAFPPLTNLGPLSA
jgi:hypothetical protein